MCIHETGMRQLGTVSGKNCKPMPPSQSSLTSSSSLPASDVVTARTQGRRSLNTNISCKGRQSCQHGPLKGTLVSCFPDAWQITCAARRGIRQAAITSASHQVLSVMCCLCVHAGRRRAVGWIMFPSLPSSELVFDPPGSLGRVGKRANARTIPPILGQIGRHSLFFYVSLIWVELRLEAWRFLRLKIGAWRRGWVPF